MSHASHTHAHLIFICVTRLCHLTHLSDDYIYIDIYIYAFVRIYRMCHLQMIIWYWYVLHDSVIWHALYVWYWIHARIIELCHTYGRVLQHIYSHMCTNESCHMCTNESCHMCTNESRHMCTNESCHTCTNESCHMCTNESCHMCTNESCHMYVLQDSSIRVDLCNIAFACVICHSYVLQACCHTHAYVWKTHLYV